MQMCLTEAVMTYNVELDALQVGIGKNVQAENAEYKFDLSFEIKRCKRKMLNIISRKFNCTSRKKDDENQYEKLKH